jgi:N-acetyl-1-D-myo-inositol-2-amino-2-deoxy-alpha-D-glucopyranoside deacetylase
MRAAELAQAEGLAPAKIYWTAIPRSVLKAGITEFADSAENPFAGIENVEDLPFGTPDEQIAARIDATAHADPKRTAVHAHATQIPADSWLNSLAGSAGREFMGVEYYTLAVGARGSAAPDSGWETDLFSGLRVDGDTR